MCFPKLSCNTNNHMSRPSCQNEWAVGCRPQRRWLLRRSGAGSFCPPPPASSLLWTQMAWQTKIRGKERNSNRCPEICAEDGLCCGRTVLRLLKRCFGASWPLQFFTYMLQLNSPSLQSKKCAQWGSLLRHNQTFHVRLFFTFRQQ